MVVVEVVVDVVVVVSVVVVVVVEVVVVNPHGVPPVKVPLPDVIRNQVVPSE